MIALIGCNVSAIPVQRHLGVCLFITPLRNKKNKNKGKGVVCVCPYGR